MRLSATRTGKKISIRQPLQTIPLCLAVFWLAALVLVLSLVAHRLASWARWLIGFALATLAAFATLALYAG